MSSQDEDLLRQLYQSLAQVELEPSDPRYVPLHEHKDCFGPDIVKELVRDVSWATEGSIFFLSGLRGSGKSTQLLRLRDNLAQQGFAAVRLDARTTSICASRSTSSTSSSFWLAAYPTPSTKLTGLARNPPSRGVGRSSGGG